jgi:hypothetical protein
MRHQELLEERDFDSVERRAKTMGLGGGIESWPEQGLRKAYVWGTGGTQRSQRAGKREATRKERKGSAPRRDVRSRDPSGRWAGNAKEQACIDGEVMGTVLRI